MVHPAISLGHCESLKQSVLRLGLVRLSLHMGVVASKLAVAANKELEIENKVPTEWPWGSDIIALSFILLLENILDEISISLTYKPSMRIKVHVK